MVLEKLDTHMEKNEFRHRPYTLLKNEHKMDQRPRCKMQNYKILEDTIGENLDDLKYSDDFLDIPPKAQSIKEIINKLAFIKIKNFSFVKDSVKRITQATDWAKIFAKDTSDKGLSKTYKEPLELNNKKTSNLIKRWAKDLYRQLIKKDKQMANRHMKRCSASSVIRKMQIKMTMSYNYIPIRMVRFGTMTPPNAGEDVAQRELSLTAAGKAKWRSHFGRQFGSILQN